MQERETGDMLLLLLLVMIGVTMVMVTIAMVVTTVLLVIQTVVTAEIEKMVRTGIKVLMVIMVMVREIMVMMMMGAVILRTLVGCVCLKKPSRGNSPSILTVGLTAHSRACSDGKQEHRHGVCIRWLRKCDTCLEDDFLITQACSGL